MPLGANGIGPPSLSETVEQALLRIASEAQLTLTLRQRLLDVARGFSYADISRRYDISVNTVKTEIRHLLRGLGVRCRHEIEHAVETAEVRTDEGASEDHIRLFLRMRWE